VKLLLKLHLPKMIKLYIVGIALAIPFFLQAQKYDDTWLMCDSGLKFNYNSGFNWQQIPFTQGFTYFRANASISDSAGNLQWYTNGFKIMNRNAQVMQGGDSINYNYNTYRYLFSYQYSGYPVQYGCMGLPYPGKQNRWLLLSTFMHLESITSWAYQKYIKTCEIDMNANGGLGAVIAKDVIGSPAGRYGADIKAVQHANGRDWWVVNTDLGKYCYNVYLLDTSGFHFKQKYCVATDTFEYLPPICFSEDGKYLISASKLDPGVSYPNQQHSIMIMNFDRCTGAISLKERISTDYMYNTENLTPWFPPDHPTYERDAALSGVAVSSNSRYLYVVNTVRIYQYDLQASTIASTRVQVAQFDGHKDTTGLGSWSTFYLTQIAPDGKIYISNGGQSRYMHVIDQPNEAGLACNVLPHSIFLPLNNYLTIPNYPNPAHDVIHITITPSVQPRHSEHSEESPTNNPNGISPYGVNDEKNLSIIIYNTEGQAMQLSPSLPVIPIGSEQSQANTDTYTINIAHLPRGRYLVSLINTKNEIMGSSKFVKQ
jgi:hypothetical protein